MKEVLTTVAARLIAVAPFALVVEWFAREGSVLKGRQVQATESTIDLGDLVPTGTTPSSRTAYLYARTHSAPPEEPSSWQVSARIAIRDLGNGRTESAISAWDELRDTVEEVLRRFPSTWLPVLLGDLAFHPGAPPSSVPLPIGNHSRHRSQLDLTNTEILRLWNEGRSYAEIARRIHQPNGEPFAWQTIRNRIQAMRQEHGETVVPTRSRSPHNPSTTRC